MPSLSLPTSRALRRLLPGAVSTALLVAAAQAQTPAGADTLIVRINADMRATDGIDRDANSDTITHHIFETLVAFGQDLAIGPELARAWTVSDDGKTYTFTLRDGALFHDGSPVTSADVVWSLKQKLDPAKDWVCASDYEGVAITAPDPQTVVFTLPEANALFLGALANIQCNAWVASPKNVGADGAWIEGSAIGSGPFLLSDWKKGQYVELKKFADYKPLDLPLSGLAGGRRAGVEAIRFQIIPDTAAAEAALYAGEIDILPGFEAARIADAKARGIDVQATPGLSWTPLLVQTLDPLLSNPAMRRAIAHAIDGETIAAVRTDGLAGFNPSAVAQASAFYGPAFAEWPEYSLEKAKAALAEAGYKGEPIRIQTNTKYQGMYDNAVMIQAMLQAAGIKAELEVLDWAAQLDNYNAGKFQLQSFGYSARLDPSQMFGRLIGDKSKKASRQWESAEAAAIYAETLTTSDTAIRKADFEKLHALMARDLPIFGLYYEPVIDAVGPKVHDYKVWAADKTVLFGVSKTE